MRSAVVVSQLRYRNRPNLQRPLPIHYKRKRMLAVCEPVLRPTPQLCQNTLHLPKTALSIIDVRTTKHKTRSIALSIYGNFTNSPYLCAGKSIRPIFGWKATPRVRFPPDDCHFSYRLLHWARSTQGMHTPLLTANHVLIRLYTFTYIFLNLFKVQALVPG